MKPLVNPLAATFARFRRISPIAIFAGIAVTALIFAGQKAGPPWEAPARAAARANPFADNADTRVKGKAIYDKMCASCHGKTGHGDGSGSKDLDISPGDFAKGVGTQTDGALFWKVTEGRKPMPSYATKLTDDERWTAIVYLRTFGTGTAASAPASAAK